MAICKLCREREANKKNTHYLTDAIIRTCLNLDGTNEREKGLYFALDNTNPFVDFNFQKLDELTLERVVGRKATDEEIEKAKSIPFSVDYVFCSQCEKLFTDIETPFIEKILPRFRQADLTGIETISVEEINIVRSFFYTQIYRSAVCEDILDFPAEFLEKLRLNILENNGETSIPLSITYLQTLGGNAAYTENYVGFTSDKNPYVIFMNDFVIQVYTDPDSIKHVPFYGLNDADTFASFININEDVFTFNIFSDANRKALLNDIVINEKVKKTIEYYKETFNMLWRKLLNFDAPEWQKERYIVALVNGDQNNLLKYSKDEVFNFTVKYMAILLDIRE